jgi:hypothetical protein
VVRKEWEIKGNKRKKIKQKKGIKKTFIESE